MQTFFSSDGPFLLQFLVIFLVILVLLMGAVLLFRRVAGRGLSLSAKAGQRGRQPRLGIVDIYELDRQRQLILLRRDNVEHLLLVGGPNDVVIERNIQRSAGVRVGGDGMLRPEPAPDLPLPAETAPAGLEPPRPDQARQDLPLFSGPSFAMPADVPVPLPGSTPPPVQTRPLDQSLFEPEAPEPAPPSRARATASAAGRILRRTPPPLVSPRPDVASERVAAPAPEIAPPSLALPGDETRTVDPAVLSDMARQLEVALRRPSSAVTPPPSRPAAEPAAAPEPAAASSEAPPAPPKPDPVAAAMAAAQAAPPPALTPPPPPEAAPPEPTSPAPAPEPPRDGEAARPVPPAAPASPATPPRPVPPATEAKPAPKPVQEPAKAPVEDTATQPAAPSSAAAPNPFSVEEIEAEFARLLGRPLDKKG